MATRTLRLYFAINEDGNAQNPTVVPQAALLKPDGSVHTAFGNATQDAGVGTGFYYREFTIDDATDVAGVYTLAIQATTDGGKTPAGVYHATVII